MTKLSYTLRFTTPAFLGDATQSGRWRTPPIKALLRQWWRVAYAADKNFAVRVDAMRREEALLFGHAWLENDVDARDEKTAARKSLVRLRLDRWDEGTLKQANWTSLGTVTHPEVRQAVASDLYMGYGPVTLPRGAQRPTLKANAAIQAGDSTTLSIAMPDAHAARIKHALTLMHRYGTLGGRSRNGWGSFSLTPLDNTPSLGGESPLRAWNNALELDWPHALGQDTRGALVWRTAPVDDWKAVMKRLAEIKIGLRTQKDFELTLDSVAGDRPTKNGINHGRAQDRHWLSYPVTNHSVAAWGNARLPNTLRFKVRPAADGKLVGVIFHVPHKPPADFRPDTATLKRVWKQVHTYLDHPAQQLTRIPE